MSVKGKTLRSQAQQLVVNLLNYFEQEKNHGGPLKPLICVQERVADALGISVSSIKRIKSRSVNNPILASPGKVRNRKKVKTTDLAENTKMAIRNEIYTMYSKHQHVTLQSLGRKLKDRHIMTSTTSLNKILHEIGFKYKKDDNRRALMEKPSIAIARIHFLKNYIKNLNSPFKRNVIFMDETWIYSKGNPGKSWQNENVKSVKKPKGYDGKRFIVVHAGSSSGFVKNASLLFASKSLKEDYHGEMNSEMFQKWLVEKLINNLEEPSLIIIDNAPYHSTVIEKMPTSAWRKADIAEWLTTNNIEFNPNSLKVELLSLAKLNKKEKRYEVDEILRNHGHEVLRLPPYHCEFNAIELIWANSKQYYNKHIGRDGYNDEKVLEMWEEALEQCSETIWTNCVRHTEDLIKNWYEREKQLDVTVEELIIQVNDADSSTSTSDNSDSD